MIQNEKHIEMKNKGDEQENLNTYFKISKTQIDLILSKYETRKVAEELDQLREFGGDKAVADALKTNFENGISENKEELEKRLGEFDSNKVEEMRVPHFCEFVWEALGDLMLRILIAAAIIQMILGGTVSEEPGKDWVDGLSILIAVLVVVLVGSVTNWSKEHKFKELNDTQNESTKFSIVRDGVSKKVTSDQLLVGDILMLNTGIIIPADAILISGNKIKMDESPLTGESDLIKKEPSQKCFEIQEKEVASGKKIDKHTIPTPVLMSGTLLKDGEGKCMIVAVGPNSCKGKIKEMVANSQEDAKTPLEEKLDRIAEQIGYFGLISGGVTLIALFIRFGISYPEKEDAYFETTQNSALFSALVQNYPSLYNNYTIYTTITSNVTNPSALISGSVLKIILLCISIVVVAIPEGLPLAVTLSLAFSIKQMMKEKNLVRKMHACETMGGANYICTDKTGTLTKNEMTVIRLFNGKEDLAFDSDDVQVENKDDDDKEDKVKDVKVQDYKNYFSEEYFKLLSTSICLNLQAVINSDPNDSKKEIVTECNKTDQGFVDFVHKFGIRIIDMRNRYYPENDEPRKIPFSSDRKRMTTIIKHQDFPTGYRVFCKGAAEMVLSSITHYTDPASGIKYKLDDVDKQGKFRDMIDMFNSNSLRSICLCYKDITEDEYNNWEAEVDGEPIVDKTDLVFISICGIRDALRNKVPKAVLTCHNAGINVIMVTGDSMGTAIAIAKDCNIIPKKSDLPEESMAMIGSDFYKLVKGLTCSTCKVKSEECKCPKTKKKAIEMGIDPEQIKKDIITDMDKFEKIIPNLRVLARSRPMDKYTLVLGLKAMKNVVAVTGDGTNDAPALSRSDVGFAMGKSGTDIAKDASDIIITDDNFASIVTAILWGRNIYDNIRKFLQFQLTVNISACVLTFICACIGNETPLIPIQMLWLNLIMDALGSLALATEKPNPALLKRGPTRRNESIISPLMWKHLLLQSLFQVGILLFLYLYATEFIKESNPVRLAEAETLLNCYGMLPGGKTDSSYILEGSSSKWFASAKLKAGMTRLQCGDYAIKQDLSVAFKTFLTANGGSVHLTIIFNTFVFLTLFNQINSRVLDDSFNIFANIQNNLLFVFVVLVEAGLQVLMVQFGNYSFHVSEYGLTGEQWGICIGLAAITFVVAFVAKLIPLEILIAKVLKTEEQQTSNQVANIHDLQHDAAKSEHEKLDVKGQHDLKKDGSKGNKIYESIKVTSKKLSRAHGSLKGSKKIDL